jgi:hypothetical protein
MSNRYSCQTTQKVVFILNKKESDVREEAIAKAMLKR